MKINSAAVEEYFNIRSVDKSQILIHKKGAVHLVNREDLSWFTLFKARCFGSGKAALCEVVKCLNEQSIDPFAKNKAVEATFQAFLHQYNADRCLGGKVCDDLVIVTPIRTLAASQTIEVAFKNCQDTFAAVKQDPSTIQALIDACEILSHKAATLNKADAHLEPILDFKNSVRAYCLPQGKQALKGTEKGRINVALSDTDAEALRKQLKAIRREVLHTRFAQELMASEREIKLLKKTLESYHPSDKKKYLKKYIKRQEKKVMEGKPKLHPKWYHCTKAADAHESILKTHIRFDTSGCFFGNYPVPGYGNFAIAMNARMESECSQDPVAGKIYPIQTNWLYGDSIVYSDQEEAYQKEPIPEIWLASLKGRASYKNRVAKPNEWIGIAIKQEEKMTSSFGYYESVVSHIFVRDDKWASGIPLQQSDHTKTRQTAKALRVPILKVEQAGWIQELVQYTFALTLQKDWAGNIKERNSSHFG